MQCFGVEERIYRQKTIKKMTETDIELIEGLRKQSPKAQQQMLDPHDPSSSMPRSTVSALGTRVCGRSVSTSFRYRLRSSMQSPPQQKTEKTARIISLY